MNTLTRRPTKTLITVISCAAIASHSLTNAQTVPDLGIQETVELKPFVVTAPRSANALETVLDAKTPYQPLPAQDGADYLKSVPGFAVIRKGGADGDPVLRGMAGSRLGIAIDGQSVLGGCSHRMDPPTAYVFPSAYDRVTILKGPQSVRYGPGASAGVVRFESDLRRLDGREAALESSVTAGSFNRFDAAADATVGNRDYYARVSLTRTESGDYEDGGGLAVHSHHLRASANLSLGWTPDDDTVLQYTAIRSDGEAAYADRLMDGVAFDRQSHQIRFLRDKQAGLMKRAEVEVGYNYIDHVMDNYSIREFAPSKIMPHPMASNPDRCTVGGRVLVELDAPKGMEAVAGLDYQENRHGLRRSMNQNTMPYHSKARIRDADFTQHGVFGEASFALGERRKAFAGLRLDNWQVKDLREELASGMMGRSPNPTAGATRDELLSSGFFRYEREAPDAEARYFAGVGRVERFLDYWELFANESTSSISGFLSRPERTTQLDFGGTKRIGEAELTVAGFFSDIDDFALVESGYEKPFGMMGTREAVVTRGIAARTWGGEASLNWHLAEHWLLDASLAYTRGDNRTDDLPLAQIAPLESRLSLSYTRRDWSLGGLLRGVASQNRVAVGQGNIVGQDIGKSPGFAVLSLNGSWRLAGRARLSAGIDNVYDTEYAEHISRAGGVVAGYAQTTRVNEPGRTLWARLDFSY